MYTLGLGLAKENFTARLLGPSGQSVGKAEAFASSAAGLRTLVKWLPDAMKTRVVFESAGIYGKPVIEGLGGLVASLHQLNPRVIKRFATSMTQTKTDHADAHAIAEVGHMLAASKPKVLTNALVVFDAKRGDLALRTAEYHRLSVDRARLKCRLDAIRHNPAPAAKEIAKGYRGELRSLAQRTKQTARKMAEAFKAYDQTMMDLLLSIPGIGAVTSAAIAAKASSINLLDSADAFKGYLGLYPRRTQSGKSESPSPMASHGPTLLRGLMWNCAKSAAGHTPACIPLYERLIAKGAHEAAAWGAVARKPVQIIYGVLKNQRPFFFPEQRLSPA